jgi:hypothetical protein
MCNYTWDNVTREYVLEQGDACTGTNCTPCARTKPAIIRELVMLEASFADPNVISHVCGGTTTDSLNSVLILFVGSLKSYKFLLKITIGFGLLSAVLLGAVIYLLMR